MAQFYCQKCKQLLDDTNFYPSNNLKKYPNGKLSLCKDCITKDIDNEKPSTYLWILEECDIPYIATEWDILFKYCKENISKITNRTIIGRYISKMKLRSFRDFRWEDSFKLVEIQNHRILKRLEEEVHGSVLL